MGAVKDIMRKNIERKYIHHHSGYEQTSIYIVSGKDCILVDSDGHDYIDFGAGVWTVIAGHSHSLINQEAKKQLDKVINIGYRYKNVVVDEAAGLLLDTLHFDHNKEGMIDQQCIFLTSGSEAVELSAQIAKKVTAKPLFLALSETYLSAYGSTGEKKSEEWYIFNWRHCKNCSGFCEHCSRLANIPFDKIAAFMFEPGNSSGLAKLPPSPLVQGLANKVKSQGGLIVVDEVTTGLGRTGLWYGFQHYSIKPDIVALGKGLGNGFPVSAVAMRAEIVEALKKTDFHYAQSHQNAPLGCAIARQVLRVVDNERLVEKSKGIGQYFFDELMKLKAKYFCITDVRGRGLMLVIELKDISLTRIHEKLLEAGLIVDCKPAENILRFYPPLTITREHISYLISELDKIIGELILGEKGV